MSKIEQKVKYTKSSNYSTVGINGVYGGITPTVKLNMNFYTEGTHVPDFSIIEADERTGLFLKETPSEELMVLRELAFAATMDLDTAKSVHMWLGQKISEMETILNQFTIK